MFDLYPALDLSQGRVVRLYKGDFARVDDYGDPRHWLSRITEAGARWLHLVDLDAARDTRLAQHALIRTLIEQFKQGPGPHYVQVGGGMRTEAAVTTMLECGADRVILGTAAVEDPELVDRLLDKAGDKLAIAIDARAGRVAKRGWLEEAHVSAFDLARSMRARGVKTFIYTDIERDGTLGGPEIEQTVALAKESGGSVIASGGVATLEDVLSLYERRAEGIIGVIIGRAYLSGALDLREAVKHVYS
ncbi:MAG: Phosphoribosylformimino-5-aminoimidazole carboxamide ribotide isomerase [Candidatus Carbobacillus altaicus]|uniref:1-(5-phosphoribosyl)-5-[(5-phosphoribosylamino)methylideneamino] imidazole-4-carboxamide isomerase n=1 Tax=Candidatus Carbonibacillus altaicus TaxID=2163959 RepID=A0A2R6XZW0_9BACL|nr:MAG: Phosphoribosylformimino-5-aminoimidazole carboxamide ribotide isomerase [Candidatus Carbobacillus altaicus]